MPLNTAAPGVFTMSRASHRPTRSTVRRACGFARIALGSEPNRSPPGVG